MFDPTAFDNMKVVVEGALYDLDLAGEIVISDRNDIVNMAKMSRSFDVCFHLPSLLQEPVTAKLEIKAELIHLAAELLHQSFSQNQSGCTIQLQFFYQGSANEDKLITINENLVDIWGETRQISQSITTEPSKSTTHHCITVEFDRLITEDQMDDLVEMIHFMLTTLQVLQSYFSEN